MKTTITTSGIECKFRAKYEYVCTDFDCVTELCSQVFGVNMRFRISTPVSTHHNEQNTKERTRKRRRRRRKETIAAWMKKESVVEKSDEKEQKATRERKRIENEIENWCWECAIGRIRFSRMGQWNDDKCVCVWGRERERSSEWEWKRNRSRTKREKYKQKKNTHAKRHRMGI